MADVKKKNVRDLTAPELQKELDTLVKALFTLRTRKVTDVVEKPSQFREHRRQIARLKTEMTAREKKTAPAGAATPAPTPVTAAPAPTPAKKAPKPKAPAKKT